MRTALLGAVVALVVAQPVWAADLSYRGYTATFAKAPATRLADSTRCQIDIVESVGLPAATTSFFRSRRIAVVPGVESGHYDPQAGVELGVQQLAEKTPVLLHEYLHAFQAEQMTDEQRAAVRSFYARARSAKLFPKSSYMLTNPLEFFAMTASTFLYGRIQRDPFTRVKLQQAMPIYYRWLGETLGVAEAALVPAGQRECD